jgi:16S rRNA (cytidine1402-2'-O)-methyltransferase
MESGVLYVVATPIGNLEDLSPRGVRVLGDVDLIACEDTRHTAKILRHFGISTTLSSYHEHNEAEKSATFLDKLEQGEALALVSDAGTPLISDPGFRLVKACREAGIPVIPVPGPSAALAALSVSGLPTDRFIFLGFPPDRTGPRKKAIERLAGQEPTLVLYLSPHKLLDTLRDLRAILGNRRSFLIREMTKLHETSYLGPLDEVLKRVGQERSRGEYTLVVAGATPEESPVPTTDVAAYVNGLIEFRSLSKKEAIKQASKELSLPKRQVYDIVLKG